MSDESIFEHFDHILNFFHFNLHSNCLHNKGLFLNCVFPSATVVVVTASVFAKGEVGVGCVEDPGTGGIKRRAMAEKTGSYFRIQIAEPTNISFSGIHFMFPVISRWEVTAPEPGKVFFLLRAELRFFVDVDQILVGVNAC